MEYTFSAKTVELALEEAAKELNLDASEIKYTVVEEGKRGLFSKQDAVISVDMDKRSLRITNFVGEIIKDFGIENVEVKVTEEEGALKVDLIGEDASYLIGRRGETMNALQYLIGLVANNGEEKYTRVLLNINDYREKREKTLEALAKRLANQAIKTGRSVTLEPMAPYERRIIHATVQDIEHVTSSSIGEEPRRRVVISTDMPRKRDFKRDSRRGNRNSNKNYAPRREAPSEDSLIKDDFLNSSSTIEGLKKEKELKEASLPLYSKIDLD